MKYEKLFDSLSATVWGKILAATVIGALAGLGEARKVSASGELNRWWIAGGGAAIGLVAGLLLGWAEIRRKRIAAGISKPLSGKARVAVVAGAMIAFFAVCLVIVYGPSYQFGSKTPRVRPEYVMSETELPAGQPPRSDPARPATGVAPPAEATAVTPAMPVIPPPVIPPPVAESADQQPPPTTEPDVAISPPAKLPANPAPLMPPTTTRPAAAPPQPPVPNPPAKPAALPAVKPVVAATMQSVAGKWKLNKTLTTTLLADGTLKTNYPAIRDGKWTLTDGETVTIYTSKGVAVYIFKLDEKGTAGVGKWKDGSKANPTKVD